MEGSPYSPLKAAHHRHRLDVLREGGQPVPSQVQLVISDRCNQNCGFCLAEGTIVDTISGPVPIERIGIGDEVHDARQAISTVTEVSRRRVKTLYEIRAGGETIRCSAEHPVLCADGFKEAGRITRADRAMVRVWVRRTSGAASGEVELVREGSSARTGSHGSIKAEVQPENEAEQSNEATRRSSTSWCNATRSSKQSFAGRDGEYCSGGSSSDAHEESNEGSEVVCAVDGKSNYSARKDVQDVVQGSGASDRFHRRRNLLPVRNLHLSRLQDSRAAEGYRDRDREQSGKSILSVAPEVFSNDRMAGIDCPSGPCGERQDRDHETGNAVCVGELLWRLEERQVSSIRRIDGDFAVYNFSCSPGESYIANGIAVHNCSYRLEGYTSNELFKVIQPDGSVDNNPKRFIPLDKCLEILDDCVSMGIGAVQITGGGEPTVHPDHPAIFAAVVARKLDFALVTNGWAVRDSILDTLSQAAWIRVSLDAGNEKTYARTRQVPETAFAKVLANVRKIRDARGQSKMILGVGFVVTAENWREIVEGTKRARDSGADNVRISAMFQQDDELYFSDFHRRAADLCREAQSLASPEFQVFNNFGDRLDDLKQHSPDYSFCGYQHFSTYIAGTLDVFRCCVQAYNPRGLIGSIKGQRFKDLWESQQKRDDFAGFDARGCARCMFNGKNRTINYLLSPDPAHVNFV